MRKLLYKLEAITNMHVGSGELNYNIVDNQVQRDPITNYPVINGSSLKGALRQHFQTSLPENEIKSIFGDQEQGKGNYRFFEGDLLAIPVRSTEQAYYMATSERILKDLKNTLSAFDTEYDLIKGTEDLLESINLKNGPVLINGSVKEVLVESFKVKSQSFKLPSLIDNFLGSEFVVFNEKDFQSVAGQLPVLTRNNLMDDGNLWYEEIVPRKTLFYTLILNEKEKQVQFENSLSSEIIQIGANATIGYGYTRFYKSGDLDE